MNIIYNLICICSILVSKHLATKIDNYSIPVVLWHGMGDSYNNPDSMGRLIKIINKLSPTTFVHSVYLSEDQDSDRNAGFFGNLNDQIDFVCKQISSIPKLKNGFNAIGFSQGGLFLRAYLERCNNAIIHNLVTLGSPHGGVSDVPGCLKNHDSVKCKLMSYLMKNGAYSYYVRDHVVQAQYVKDPSQYPTYLKYNIFLPDINNEKKDKNSTYNAQIKTLKKLVLYKFEHDTILIPKDTAWFSTYELNNPKLISLKDQVSFKKDWLGLKTLYDLGKIEFLVAPFEHMQFTESFFIDSVLPHVLNITADNLSIYKSLNRAYHSHQVPFNRHKETI